MTDTNNSDRLLSGVKNIIAVGAGKGGVGKSTIAVHLAVGLRRASSAVGLMDCDIYGPSIATMTGIEGAAPLVADKNKIAPFDACGLKVISMANFIPPDAAMIWRGPMVHGAVKQFLTDVDWGELDYLVVDLPPGTGDPPLTLAQTVGVTGAIIVTTPQALAINDAMRAAQMYRKLGIHVLGVVENMSYFVCPACQAEHDIFGRGGAKKAAEQAALPLLGEIPMNLSMRVNTDGGDAEADFDESQNPAVAGALAAMVENVTEQVKIRKESQPPAEPIRVGKK
ncbi:MAG: Mrp/NBP35 family ATP-binding protein [Planctomycetota bacterium]|nr:Mrp/NBP35 family ATP-binding protein [Planctomycetota bacterium]